MQAVSESDCSWIKALQVESCEYNVYCLNATSGCVPFLVNTLPVVVLYWECSAPHYNKHGMPM